MRAKRKRKGTAACSDTSSHLCSDHGPTALIHQASGCFSFFSGLRESVGSAAFSRLKSLASRRELLEGMAKDRISQFVPKVTMSVIGSSSSAAPPKPSTDAALIESTLGW